MSDDDARKTRKTHARGSEQRQKQCRVTTRLTWQEHTQFAARAAAAGLTIPSYIREIGIGECQTKSRTRRTPEAETSMRLIAAMNRVGNNLNQLARQANSGERVAIGALQDKLRDAIDAVLATYGGAG